MKKLVLAAALLVPLPAFAQSPAPPPIKLFASSANVKSLIAGAKGRTSKAA